MKKKNEDIPENLDGLGDMLPAEVLKKLKELLETLHHAEANKEGSTVIYIYEKGSQHIDTQINIETLPIPPCLGRGKSAGDLPEVLSTEKAMVLWKKAQDAGWVDDNYQPLISHTQSALLADVMAESLGIREKWKVFEKLWNRKNMYKDYYQAVEQKQFLPFLNKLKQILD